MTEKSNITVLLSSYNGERYIEQQIESILAQTGVRVRLVVRDDGSTDNTPDILRQLGGKHENISILTGENVGFVQSFFDLLKTVDDDSEFYAFSDQDDFWLPNKLAAAVSKLRENNQKEPLLYFSAVEYVDASLNHLAFSAAYETSKIGFGNALVQNVAIGCTTVMNSAARNLVVSRLPRQCSYHDWWVYLVISAFGKVVFDNVPAIKYRQHGANVVGAAMSFRDNMRRRIQRFLRYTDSTKTSAQIAEFYSLFGFQLKEEQRLTVRRMLDLNTNVLSRFLLVFSKRYWRQSWLDQLLLRLVILSGRF